LGVEKRDCRLLTKAASWLSAPLYMYTTKSIGTAMSRTT
jgi:hypothetical protein